MSIPITNGNDTLISENPGTLPFMGEVLLDWFQPLTIDLLTKTVVNSKVVETATSIDFQGVWQPLDKKRIEMKPSGQWAWSWFLLHTDPSVSLAVDDVVIFQSVQYRVQASSDYSKYGYLEYELTQDWTGSGP